MRRVAPDHVGQRVVDRLQEHVRHPGGGWTPIASRRRAASSIAAQRGCPPIRTGITLWDGGQVGEGVDHRHPVAANFEIFQAQRTEVSQQVVEAVGRPDPALGSEVLELELDCRQHLGGDQFGQFAFAEQAPEQVAVEGQGGGPAFGDGSVGLVEEGSHECEQQRRGEGGRPSGLDLDDPDAPRPDVGQDLFQGRQVEVVGQHLAVGLEDYREGPVVDEPRRAGRRPGDVAARAGFGSPACGEGGGAPDPPPPETGLRTRRCRPDALRPVGGLPRDREQRSARPGGIVGIGKPEGDAVVGPDDVDIGPKAAAELVGQGHGPGGVDPGAERREEDHPPVADLVPKPFDHQGLVGGQDPGGFLLLGQIGHEVAGREGVEVVVGGRGWRRRLSGPGAPISLTNRPMRRPVAIDRPRVSPFQNGSLGGRLARGRDHLHPVRVRCRSPSRCWHRGRTRRRPVIRRPSLRRVRRPGSHPGG